MVEIAFEKFLYAYVIFLFFLVFLIGSGAGDFFSGNIAGLVAPTPPIAPQTDNPIIDFLTGAINTGIYYFSNIIFFFQLMTIDTGVAWIGLIIFSPAIIFLIWGVMKHLIRG